MCQGTGGFPRRAAPGGEPPRPAPRAGGRPRRAPRPGELRLRARRTSRALALGLAAAGGTALALLPLALPVPAARAAPAPLQVVTTTEDLAAIAREVGGERVRVAALCRGYQDPHFVDAKPSYMVQLKNADLFVQVGRDLEVGWAPGLLNGARNPRILPGAPGFVDASAQVEVLEVPASVSRAQGDVHPYGNPHYWLDPGNGVAIARAIRDGLARVSPADAGLLARRCEDFERRLAEAGQRWRARARDLGLAGTAVVTYHRTWSYFARAFGLEVADLIEPRPGIPPSPGHVRDLVGRLRQGGVRLLLIEEFFDPRLPRKLSRDTGIPLAVLPTSVGAEEGIRTYFDLFDRLLTRIGEALHGGAKP